ncbi:hypothetical protein [Actinokineospora sp. UTMC 2448]|uniref:hypothetical protein n=1 Tax=Actinokineospora sp. UTMC 2448 TaxID=2268449 RepID=UPI002164A685|nr:hypothetical protein [Actinokineospora sp. UTMC 2448]UVS81832.1 hypothetical protein Actkin_05596 [Actinokineospora sp. UTMC 2448]
MAAPEPTVLLGPRGLRLWEALHPDGARLSTADAMVAEEACRLVDRLDRFDEQMSQGAFLELDVVDDDTGAVTHVRVVVDRVVTEARLHALALAKLLHELRRIGTPASEDDGDEVDEVAARRARRLAAPAG